MPQPPLPLDVRTLVTYVEGNPLSREEFDQAHFALNRTLFLLDNLPFRDLFTWSLSPILQHLQTQAAKTETFHLLEEPHSVAELQQELERIYEVWSQLDTEAQQETLRHPVSVVIPLLRAHHILLPDFQENAAAKTVALEGLLATAAANLTYRDVFAGTRTALEEHPGALESVQQAVRTELLPPKPNGMCCANHECQPGNPTDFCLEGEDHRCVPGTVGCI